MRIIALALALSASLGYAQSPPQIPLTGNIGVAGSVAVLGGLTVQMPADANYTLTPAQWSNKTLIITSATTLTATRNIVGPLTKGQEFNIENSTTGGQSITVIAASGTGVTITAGQSASVFCDGVNYVQSSGGAGTGVVTISVATANGLQGSSSGGANPSLTIGPDGTHVIPVNTGTAGTYLDGTGAYSAVSAPSLSGTALPSTVTSAPGLRGAANVAINRTNLLAFDLFEAADYAGGTGTTAFDKSGLGNNCTIVTGTNLTWSQVASAYALTFGNISSTTRWSIAPASRHRLQCN